MLLGASNPASVGKGLNTVGDFAYAYSGVQNATDAGANFFDFTSGQYIFDGKLQVLTADQSGNEIKATVTLNGEIAVEQTYRNDGNGPAGIFPLDLVIPAETRVEVKLTNASGGGNKQYSAAIVGRIYA
jgi:hypothetical protein|tara:strand:- start:217 stop:603 length:387 start_codon:yes stop_codon:yes gene_type:complete